MKKIILSLVVLVSTLSFANAQEIFSKGTSALNIGVGIGGTLITDGYSVVIPPLSVSYDYAVVDNLIENNNGSITVGGYLGYASSKYKEASYNYSLIGARGAFHYQFVKKLDTYVGAMLAMSYSSSSVAGSTTRTSGLGWSTFIGARYMFSDNIGAFVEAGWGVTALTAGVTFRY